VLGLAGLHHVIRVDPIRVGFELPALVFALEHAGPLYFIVANRGGLLNPWTPALGNDLVKARRDRPPRGDGMLSRSRYL
jgi:hypothetical protein